MNSTRSVLAAALALLAGSARADPAAEAPTSPPAMREPTMGTICAVALYSAVQEVGKRCFPGEDAEFQAELGRAVARLDSYMLSHSDMDQAALDSLKREQSLVGAPKAELCSGDPVGLYRAFAGQGSEYLRAETERITARPGPATWGDCL
jgi:hypothetical protein